jgi:hypothetical protein
MQGRLQNERRRREVCRWVIMDERIALPSNLTPPILAPPKPGAKTAAGD